MTALAKAVHRGDDGSVHYLVSTPESSLLVITDPVLGVDRIPFDGPVRMLPPRAPLGVPGEVTGVVEYESISASGSTRGFRQAGGSAVHLFHGRVLQLQLPAAGSGRDGSQLRVVAGLLGG
jgi:hypothetical protein